MEDGALGSAGVVDRCFRRRHEGVLDVLSVTPDSSTCINNEVEIRTLEVDRRLLTLRPQLGS